MAYKKICRTRAACTGWGNLEGPEDFVRVSGLSLSDLPGLGWSGFGDDGEFNGQLNI